MVDETESSSTPRGAAICVHEQQAQIEYFSTKSSPRDNYQHRIVKQYVARISPSVRGAEVLDVNDAGVSPLGSSTPTVVHIDSTDGLDHVLYSNVGLLQSHKAFKCWLIPLQPRVKLIQNRKENLKTFPSSNSSFYKPI